MLGTLWELEGGGVVQGIPLTLCPTARTCTRTCTRTRGSAATVTPRNGGTSGRGFAKSRYGVLPSVGVEWRRGAGTGHAGQGGQVVQLSG
jgi:hypothetical protein